MIQRVLVDGREHDRISVGDRGLHYGDGLFETILIRDGMPCLWDRHMARLALGADRLGLPRPSPSMLRDEAVRIGTELDHGLLKLILTRGVGGRGYRPPATPHPRRILLSYASSPSSDPWIDGGVAIRFCETPASVNSHLAGIKHLNRLDAVLARREWDDPEIAEGLMCDEAGSFVGGTMTNLFVWDGVALATPSVTRSGLAGTVRAVAIEAASRAGIACVERPVTRRMIEEAVGLFLTNARIGVWPVSRLADRLLDPERLPLDLLSAVRRTAHTPEWSDP
ncbi:aminodeoxychorismate lyase [Thiocapsa roseopersicina]|uniref:Aminodeoxychorismate lyase n=1 Tax=Thiocapsa roseopersicina TaxID=1058 RepID=A0A1H2YZN1_THIRO|nr:aminodeoxychorismate lyase [Thiocapsa roseopersicina]SDX10525.1 aminodeoxychorismate lyase apoprotein [Thiocapsa roseopersicina]